MNVRNLFTDDDAVSPVIGVILMVAITVILAAVIGAFVLNIGGSQDTAPQASFDFESSGGHALITMASGSEIELSTISIQYGDSTDTSLDVDGETWTSGESHNTTDAVDTGETVDVVWSSSSSDKSSVLASWEMP